MKDMEEARKRATAWIVFSAVYAMMAAIAVVLGFFWAEAFVPLVSMICAAACFELGRDYQVEMARERREVTVRFEEQHCNVCRGTDFREIAGRFVCNTCGEVMEHGKEA